MNNLDLFYGIEEFFDSIKAKCFVEEEYAAEFLKARGFLLEDGLTLSDNSHKDDTEYLNELLAEENLERIFFKDNRIGGEAFCCKESWKKFIHNSFAPKIPVRFLEPFIARYVKAISACGVNTWCSCDGNHPTDKNFQKILVSCTGLPNEIWHKIIFKKCLTGRFNLKFKFHKKDKWKIYIEFNRAGKFLYDNRLKIRQIRREVSDGISNRMIKNLSDYELAEIFSERANKLFDKFFNE